MEPRRHKHRRRKMILMLHSNLFRCNLHAPEVQQPVLVVLLLLQLVASEAFSQQQLDPQVHLPKVGPISGLRLVEANTERQALGFLGIPYAAAPIGPLRFMPAAAYQWPRSSSPGGRRNHVSFGSACPQLSDWPSISSRDNRTRVSGAQNEDCLNLNLFLPLPAGEMEQQAINTSSDSRVKLNSHGTTRNQETIQAHQVNRINNGNKRPILVLLHGPSTSQKANSYDYLSLVRATRSIVVTFNYRLGLLGFLPYNEGGSRALPRNNHAIWDQIGLLHWLHHNIIHFNGDPRNITLVSVDNQAAQLALLLALTPHTKGLVSRLLLVHDETTQAESTLSDLLKQAQDGRESRRKLTVALGLIVQRLFDTSNASSSTNDKVLDFIQWATMDQLAKVDRELTKLVPNKVLLAAHQPTLDDRLLFPNLSSLMKLAHLDREEEQIKSENFTLLTSEINYCTYLRTLYSSSNSPDPLNLVPSRSNHLQKVLDGNVSSLKWHREADKLVSRSHVKRKLIASNFNHLKNLQQMNDLLLSLSYQDQFLQADAEGEDDEEEAILRRQRDRSILMHGNSVKREVKDTSKRVSFDNGEQKVNIRSSMTSELEELSLGLSTLDVMIGYIGSHSELTGQETSGRVAGSGSYSNIAHFLKTQSSKLPDGLLFWLKLADKHFISALANEDTIVKYCDFFSTNETSIKSTHVFLIRAEQVPTDLVDNKTSSDWITLALDSYPNVVNGLRNFINSGNPNGKIENQKFASQNISVEWPAYETLTRSIKIVQNSESTNEEQLKEAIQIQMELVPYLNEVSASESYIERRNDRSGLMGCLSELDSAINKSRGRGQRLQDETACLSETISKLRLQLRQYANEDLEPLVKLAKQQADHLLQHSASSPITTRNLVNEALLENQHDAPDASNQSESASYLNSSTLFRNNPTYTTASDSSSGRPDNQDGIKGFFAKAYRDAVGKALAIVVGTGLLILALNLIIVVIITVRSTRARRRTLHSVCDSSSHLGNELNPNNGFNESNEAKKSTLKRSNQAQTSSFKLDRSVNETPKAKHLKFDLTSVERGDNKLQDIGQELEYNFSLDPNEGQSISILDPHVSPPQDTDLELQQQQQQQVELAVNTHQHRDSGLYLSTSQLVDGYSSTSNTQHLTDCLYPSEQNQWLDNLSDSQHLQNPSSHHYHQCTSSSLNSPFASQSYSTTNTSGNCAHLQQPDYKMLQTLPQVNQPSCRFNHSATSPSSSTTLSLTPIQLESLANKINPEYSQLAANFGLVYDSELNRVLQVNHQDQFSGQAESVSGDKLFVIAQHPDTNCCERKVNYCHHHKHNHENR